jgi:hypothetical protein
VGPSLKMVTRAENPSRENDDAMIYKITHTHQTHHTESSSKKNRNETAEGRNTSGVTVLGSGVRTCARSKRILLNKEKHFSINCTHTYQLTEIANAPVHGGEVESKREHDLLGR